MFYIFYEGSFSRNSTRFGFACDDYRKYPAWGRIVSVNYESKGKSVIANDRYFHPFRRNSGIISEKINRIWNYSSPRGDRGISSDESSNRVLGKQESTHCRRNS